LPPARGPGAFDHAPMLTDGRSREQFVPARSLVGGSCRIALRGPLGASGDSTNGSSKGRCPDMSLCREVDMTT
jgi:hypothetical protein